MKKAFTLKQGQALLLWGAVLLCLLPFIILCFFSFKASDDYILCYYYRTYGFIKAQQVFYTEWAGRFTTTFLSNVFVKYGIVSRFYFLLPLFLYLSTWAAIFFSLAGINRRILSGAFPRAGVILASFLLFFLNLYVMAEISTGFYWFSAAIVYQTAVILFLVLCGCLVRRFYGTGDMSLPEMPALPDAGKTRLKDVLIILLLLLICGCNEVATVFLVLFLSSVIAANFYYRRVVPKIWMVYLAAAVLAGIVIVFTSGVISVRQKLMNSHTGYLSILPIIVFRSAAVFYYILKEPVFWLSAVVFLTAGIKISATPAAGRSSVFLNGKPVFIPGLLTIGGLIVLTLTAVLLASRGSLPPRALNNLTSFGALCLSALFFVTGISNPALARSLDSVPVPRTVLTLIWVSGLMASVPQAEAWKSVLSGYFYHAVLVDREQTLLRAGANHQRTATVIPYEEARQQKIDQAFPHGVFETVNSLLLEKPSVLYYCNEAENTYPVYLSYYGLDKIIVDKK